MNRKRKFVFYTIIVGINLLLFLTILEFAGRYAFRNQLWVVKDLEHRPPPNIPEHNADGIRCEREARDFTPEHLNIIFLGDSFTYGAKVRAEFAFPQQFETLANTYHPEKTVHVANFGWTSSSPFLSLRLLKAIGAKYHPDVVFLCIDMTDFFDDRLYEYLAERSKMMYKALGHFPGIVLTLRTTLDQFSSYAPIGKFYEALFDLPADHYFIVNKPLSQTQKYSTNIITNINSIYDYTTKNLQAKFILIILPRSFQYSAKESPLNWEGYAYEVLGPYVHEPFKLFAELQKNVNYPIYSLLETFQNTSVYPTCLYDDPHWNADGHKVAAEKIYEIAEQTHIFEKR